MEKEKQFAESLQALLKTAKEQQNILEERQITEAFPFMELGEERMTLIREYLAQNKIGIGEAPNSEDYMTAEEKNYLDEYLETIAALPSYSEGEKDAITLSAMAGESAAKEKLIEIFLPQVVDIARLYVGEGVYLEDLIGEGNLAVSAGVSMLSAMENAKEAQGMLGKMIMDAMEDLITENLKDSELDKEILDKVNLVSGKATELAEDYRRKVTIEELARETGLSEEEIKMADRLSGYKIEDLDANEE